MKRALVATLVTSLFVTLLGGIASAEVLRDSVGPSTDRVVLEERGDVEDAGFRNVLRRCRRVLADEAPSADAVEKCREFWKRWCEAHPNSRLCRRPDVEPPRYCRIIIDRVGDGDEISDRLWEKCAEVWKRWCKANPEKCREVWKRWCEAHPASRACPPSDFDPPDCRIVDRATDRVPDRLCPVPIDPPVDPPTDPPKCRIIDGAEVCRVPIDPPDCPTTASDELCRVPIDPPICLHADHITDVRCVPIPPPTDRPMDTPSDKAVDRPSDRPVLTPAVPDGTIEESTDRLSETKSDDTHVRLSRADL